MFRSYIKPEPRCKSCFEQLRSKQEKNMVICRRCMKQQREGKQRG